MRINKRNWLNRPEQLALFLLLALLAPFSHGNPEPPPPYVIHSLPEQARITIYSEYLEDESGKLTIADLNTGQGQHPFQPATRSLERLGIRHGNWWVRIAIRNELRDPQEFILHLRGNPLTQLYLPGTNGRYRPAPADSRLPGRDTSYRLSLPTGQTQLLYFRLQPQGYLTYGLSLETLNTHISAQASSDAVYMSLAGMLLAMALYNALAGALANQGRAYYHHSLFLLSILLISLILADFLPLLSGPSEALQPRLLFMAMMVGLIAATDVSRCFFDLPHQAGWIDPGSRLLQLAALAFMPLALFLPLPAAAAISFILLALGAFLLLLLGYSAWHREMTGGGMFFLTALLISLPAMLISTAYLGLLQTNAELPQWLMLSALAEAVVLGLGLRMQHQHQRHLEVEKKRSQAVADTISSTRREALSRLGHDVRTPLSGILGMAEILGDTPLTPNQRECVNAIQHAGDNLLRVVNDALENAQLSQDQDIHRSAVDIHDLIMEAIDLFKEKAEEKHIELITHVHTNVPYRVMGDAGRLRQILTNMMGALVRHGTPGELILDVSMEPTGLADRVRFGFSGSALGEDSLQQLQQSPRTNESSHLSLTIAAQLVEALHGRMGTLQDHNGGHYWFAVPLPAEDAPAPPAPLDTSVLTGRSLLVVDDSTTVTRVLRHHALSWGMRVTACHDPREALASLRTQANINEPYDVVILDHNMPGMDGMQLAARIHEDPVIIHPTVLVMLTGINNAPTATQARNVGIHRVLSKPVSAPRLRQALAEQLGSSASKPVSSHSEQKPDPELRILVAEDHYLSQKVIKGMLGKLGLKADIASDGKEALKLATSQPYDLILMDCEMPEMDGFEATRRIRQHEQQQGLPGVPIVALTAHILREHKERSLAAGMNAHLPKPVELSVLRETLVRFTQPDAEPGAQASQR